MTDGRDDVPRSDVAAAYDRWAASYDSDINATRDLDARVLRHSGLVIDGRDVLELGAGTGKNTVWLAEHARSVVALDFSPEMLARARQRVGASNVTFIQADLRAGWPIESESVDVVVGNLVLEHIADCRHIFAEIARVVRSAGVAYVAELHPDRQQRGGQAQFTDATGDRVFVPAFIHTAAEFREAATAAGLRIVEFTDHIESPAHGDVPRLLSMQFVRAG